MTNKWILSITIVILGIGQSLASASLSEEVRTLVKKVDARYLETQDFEANFSQETQIEGFETRLVSSGRVIIKKPGLLRWDYHKPNIEQILVKGDEVLWYVPQHQQVVKGNLTQMASSKAPLALLQGAGNLGEQFDVMPSKQEGSVKGALPTIVLMPKPKDQATSAVTRIELTIQPKSYLIKVMTLFEKSGNVSSLRFSEIRTNQGVDADVLKLDLPDDVVVIDAPTM